MDLERIFGLDDLARIRERAEKQGLDLVTFVRHSTLRDLQDWDFDSRMFAIEQTLGELVDTIRLELFHVKEQLSRDHCVEKDTLVGRKGGDDDGTG